LTCTSGCPDGSGGVPTAFAHGSPRQPPRTRRRRPAPAAHRQDRELTWRQTKIDQLTHELSLHKRWRFGVKTERLPAEQAQLFEETVEADLAAMTEELEQLSGKPSAGKGQAKRKPLPPELPRTEIHHEPDSTTCACGCQMKRIGEDVAEKLDYTPAPSASSATSAASGSVPSAKPWCRPRCPPT
jgi:hypothetical protein